MVWIPSSTPFISYAQNYEDVILWRALGKIDHGFYVDIGAFHPRVDSVTKAFYDRGWRGINVEPISELHQNFVVDRPEDTNLNVAISDVPGAFRMHHVIGTGLSTFNDALSNDYRARTSFEIQDTLVPVLTLDGVLDQYVNTDLHFLKVDVEGWERQVFKSVSLIRVRPWIILAESKSPPAWEPLLTDRQYDFAYFDGLNRFYIANEQSDLKAAFEVPPNIFDEFVRVREHDAVAALHAAQDALKRTEDLLAKLQESKSL